MDNFAKNMLSFLNFFHIYIPASLVLNKAHMNQYDTTFCINGFHTIKIFHNYLCREEQDLCKFSFVFQSRIQLFYVHMDSILVCMDLGDKAHTYHRDIFSHMNASHNLVELRINFNILFFCFHKMQHFFLFCKNIQMSIQFSKDHKDLRDIFFYIHEQDNLKVYCKGFRN